MRRGLIIAVGWVSAVIAGTVVGISAITTLGTSTGDPLSQREVSDRLAHTSPAPIGRATAPAGGAGSSRQYFTTSGGSLWASCTGDQATLQTVTPRSGYRLDDWNPGPASTVSVEFEHDAGRLHGTDYRVTITCPAGVPHMVETPHTWHDD